VNMRSPALLCCVLFSFGVLAQTLPPAPKARVIDINPKPGYFNEPSIAVNTKDPQKLVVAWQVNASVAYSDDGGQTWTGSFVVDDVTGIHFSPTVSVDSAGNVNVFFYDRRENPGTSTTNVYFAQSADGGATFAPNIRVTEVATTWGSIPSDITPNFGDYMTSLSVGTDVLITWSDGRNGDPDSYFARLTPAMMANQ